jgi:general secretion pathway protein C
LLRKKNLPYDARSSPIDPPEANTLMDVAKRLAEWRDRSPEQWFTTVNHFLPPGITAILVIAIAYQLATLTWTLVPGSTPTAAPPPPSAQRGAQPATDYSVLKGLFGVAAEQPEVQVPEVIDAPDTTLSLTLRGILSITSSKDDTSGSVIIESRSESKTYYTGQTIDNADGATLHSVYADRALLNRGGRIETLRFPKDLSASSSGTPMAMPPLPQAQAQQPLRQVLSENAARLQDIIRPAPHVQEGQIVGFRVNPGRDRAAFEALGFQAGDVVTDVNGTVLDDVSQGLQIFQSLGESTQANVTVLRDGVPQVIVIDTTQLQRLQENRENRE